MNSITHYYLVDMENVQLKGLQGLNLPGEGSEIRLFLSNAMHTGNLEVQKAILASKAKIETFYCSVQGKNAMDFEMAAYCGKVLTDPDVRRISLISKDKGFQALVDYARQVRKNVIVYQAQSILEAYVAAESELLPDSYEKGKAVDFSQIMKAVRESRDPLRQELGAFCEEEEIQEALNLSREMTPKERYLTLLKRYGRGKGTAMYRVMKKYS